LGQSGRSADNKRFKIGQNSFDYLRVESTGTLEPLPAAATRLGRRTARTFPLLPPPQNN